MTFGNSYHGLCLKKTLICSKTCDLSKVYNYNVYIEKPIKAFPFGR